MTVNRPPQAADELVTFIRRRDYRTVRELGRGACGKTVLLHDEQIDEHFVCKKYEPSSNVDRSGLFAGFVREVKLLHKVLHENVVRVFNYYLYPDRMTGYILMEYVDGVDIEDYLEANPHKTNDLFLQAVTGFAYLERVGILHRDIRPANLMVRADGMLKIIDLGFGKQVECPKDFDKSISLNWWCDPPLEFQAGRYDFTTEVYFLGQLFLRIIKDNHVEHFKYRDPLFEMCHRDPEARISSFAVAQTRLRSNTSPDADFSEAQLAIYRRFSDAICRHITKVETGAKYVSDVSRVIKLLSDVYQKCMLETTVPDSRVVIQCFINGAYYFKKQGLDVEVVRDFLALLTATADERAKIILANLHAKLDALPRYSDFAPTDDEIPF